MDQTTYYRSHFPVAAVQGFLARLATPSRPDDTSSTTEIVYFRRNHEEQGPKEFAERYQDPGSLQRWVCGPKAGEITRISAGGVYPFPFFGTPALLATWRPLKPTRRPFVLDYDLPSTRPCCGEAKRICPICFGTLTEAVGKVHTYCTNHILLNDATRVYFMFSGGRGFHLYVQSTAYSYLDEEARQGVLAHMGSKTGIQFDLKFGLKMNSALRVPFTVHSDSEAKYLCQPITESTTFPQLLSLTKTNPSDFPNKIKELITMIS